MTLVYESVALVEIYRVFVCLFFTCEGYVKIIGGFSGHVC